MAQEIKIGVKGDLSGANAVLDQIDKATGGVGESVRKVGQEARAATRDINALDAATKRLQQTQKLLQRELGHPVSASDAEAFQGNFERMRTGRGIGARRLRGFNGFDEWYHGHSGSFSRSADAERHRRYVMSAGMQGTDYSRDYGAPPGPSEPGEGGGGGGSDPFHRSVGRAQNIAMGFVKGGLAMAGISSVAAMAGQAVDYATEESTGTDTLKRRMGDLGADFATLQNQVRNAADGFGVTYVESIRFAQQFAKEAGNLTGGDAAKMGGQLHNAYGFSRAFGIDPSESVQFFASMQRTGAIGGKDDPDGRKMAGHIADAIERGGYGGKADEVLAAVANFSDTFSRNSLGTANISGYAGMLSGLTKTGLPGLDPAGAAGILSTADSSIRKGGGMGEAGQNFNYMAMMHASQGMDPVAAKALMQGGLFASTNSIFGKGKALSGMYGGQLDDVTNLEKIRDQTKKFYGTGNFGVEAFANNTGLTLAQAKELFTASPLKLSQAKDLDPRMKEKDEGTKTRDSIAALKNELTRVGGVLLEPLNLIRESVVALADHFAPKTDMISDGNFATNEATQNPALTAYLAANPKGGAALGKLLNSDAATQGKWAMRGAEWMGSSASSMVPDSMYHSAAEKEEIIQARKTQSERVHRWISMMGDTDKQLGLKHGSTLAQAMLESSMNQGATGPLTKSGEHAVGLMQFMPGTWNDHVKEFKKRFGHEPNIRRGDDSILMNRIYKGELLKNHTVDQANSYYNSGHWDAHNPETLNYVATLGGHPMPRGKQPGAGGAALNFRFSADPVTLIDPSGMVRGTLNLKPVKAPVPAGH